MSCFNGCQARALMEEPCDYSSKLSYTTTSYWHYFPTPPSAVAYYTSPMQKKGIHFVLSIVLQAFNLQIVQLRALFWETFSVLLFFISEKFRQLWIFVKGQSTLSALSAQRSSSFIAPFFVGCQTMCIFSWESRKQSNQMNYFVSKMVPGAFMFISRSFLCFIFLLSPAFTFCRLENC